MTFQLKGATAEELYTEACWQFNLFAQLEESRNGRVKAIPGISTIELSNPRFRIVNNPDRDANPFFHCMEFIWMMAGRNDLEWIWQFNKGIEAYAEPEKPYEYERSIYSPRYFHGAYGHRWRNHFGFDQIQYAIDELSINAESRRVVIAMWDPEEDLGSMALDIPCNTQIMLRAEKGYLDMTVINRSNDLIWGALGANIVHMTMLHELIAAGAELSLGTYRLVSANLHVYEKHWPLLTKKSEAQDWMEGLAQFSPLPLIELGNRDVQGFLEDAENFCNGKFASFKHKWFREVASPMLRAYLNPKDRIFHTNDIKCPAWQQGAKLWQARRAKQTTGK